METSGKNNFLRPLNPAATGVLIILAAVVGLGLSFYDLWHDWERRHLDWGHLVLLLGSICLTIYICQAARRAMQSRRKGNSAADKAA